MSLIKKNKEKIVNFEFNKEYIKVIAEKITSDDATFIVNSFKASAISLLSESLGTLFCPPSFPILFI